MLKIQVPTVANGNELPEVLDPSADFAINLFYTVCHKHKLDSRSQNLLSMEVHTKDMSFD